jgi:hypothetical protein
MFRRTYGVAMPVWGKRLGPWTYRMVGVELLLGGVAALSEKIP